MKTDLYIANNLISSAKKMFSSINDKNEKHYIIVPDRFSLTVEKQILKTLNKKCCFNVEVLTLSRLCNRYIKNENKKLLSKNESIMLIKKCVLENQDNLMCFKSSSRTENFSENIFETIMQLKSCNINPSQLTDNLNISSSLNLKIADIKCIFESYEKHLQQNYIDSFNKLKLFCENMFKYKELKNYNVHFAYFESFTPLILNVINSLMRNCKSVNFALQLPSENQNNKHIYSFDIYNQILIEAQSNAVEVNKIYVNEENSIQSFLRNNLYSYKNSCYVAGEFIPNLISFSTIQNELEFVCADIQKNIIENNDRYFNFAIACANSEIYFPAIKLQLEKFNIPYYIDQSKTLNQTILCDLFINCLNYFENHKTRTIFFNILDNPILNLSNKEINIVKNFCVKYNITFGFHNQFKVGIAEKDYQECENVRKKVFDFIEIFKNLNTCEDVKDYVYLGKLFLENEDFCSKYENFIKKIEYIDLFQHSIENQASEKLLQILDNANEILNNQKISLKEFIEIIKSGTISCNISNIPLSVDCVFVGDVNASVFSSIDNLYICGANQQNFPVIKQDIGLISDYELSKLNQFVYIEPTIRVINQRTRLKCMQLTCSFNKNLTLTYSILDGAGNANTASEIIKEISNHIKEYNKETKQFVNLLISNEDEIKNKSFYNNNLKNLCYDYVNTKNAETKIINEIKNNPQLDIDYNFNSKQVLYNYLIKNSANFSNLLKNLHKNSNICENSNKVIFRNNNTSTTQIETYFSCPFKHFMKYALKAKENENGENLSAAIGTLLHSVAEFFVQYLIKNGFEIEQKQLCEINKDFFNKSIIENKFQYITENSDNKLLLEDLLNESERMCLFIFNSIKNSKFKPISTELGFGEKYNFKEITLNVNSQQYKIGGKIDRIDAFDNKFIIIDYKTGSTTFSLEDLYYGQKVQLFVYQFAITDQTGQVPVGIFYLPIKNVFSNENDVPYQLDGVITNNVNVVMEIDTNLTLLNPVSKTLPVKIAENKKTKQLEIESKNAQSEKNIQKLSKFAIKNCENAVNEMNNNFIEPKPIKDSYYHSSCTYCAYKSICKFNIETDGYRERLTVSGCKEGGEE